MESTQPSSHRDSSRRELRIGYVPGATPAKWVSRFAQRHPKLPVTLTRLPPHDRGRTVAHGEVDMGIVRLPVPPDIFYMISLYDEVSVALFPRDHHFAAADQLLLSDLAEETVLQPREDMIPWRNGAPGNAPAEQPETTDLAVQLVAAGVGIVVLPQSVARLHARKDLEFCPVDDAPLSPVGLVWRQDSDDEILQEFAGIVRGRTAKSSRGLGDTEPENPQKGKVSKGTDTRKTPRRATGGAANQGKGKGGARKMSTAKKGSTSGNQSRKPKRR
ncbi:LysR family transcriptional regulator substrate-binding protein [Jonesia quinghaiensis]|uniref:LysR family transcriptional regulator substrate-binding protein n=1 Tax=Jonesia quinghaiensis TaxID=262806 RepID=UPI0004104898|nr:LysR family transcriptional regulator substrate-binding protein [Jonesia quinghaiensis]